MKRFFLVLPIVAACAAPEPRTPRAPSADLPRIFADAFRVDATEDTSAATKAHLDVVHAAATGGPGAWQIPALEASLDALASRTMPSLGDASEYAALAWRSHEGRAIETELRRLVPEATGSFARGLLARSLAGMAIRRGDAAEAERERAASGCVRRAVVVGPTTWAPVTGVEEPGPLANADARLEASYAVGDAFGTRAQPIAVEARGCAIPLSADAVRPGVRDVVVDADVADGESVGVVLRSRSAAVLRAGGAVAVARPFELGDGAVARFARVRTTGGTLRVVARVGTSKDDESVEIDLFHEDGSALPSRAPAIGSVARARALGVETLSPGVSHSPHETLLLAAAALSSGDPRDAERTLWPAAVRPDTPPDLALAYARAVETARDLSQATRAERARSAYARVLEVWPSAWEAVIGEAVLSGVRRGRDEGGIETLRSLDARRAKSGELPVLDAFDALMSGREHLFDRARSALERARPALAGTALFGAAEDGASPRLGPELARAMCDDARVTAHDSLACFDALRAAGDRPGAAKEIERLRSLLGGRGFLLPLELREDLIAGDSAGADRAFRGMLPGERTLAALSLLDVSPDRVAHLLREATIARDSPSTLPALVEAAGQDASSEFDGIAERLAAEDRATPILPSAPTAVLAHTERYRVSAAGLVHWTLFDVRRVSGTTDVEENAQAAAPDVWGRDAQRAVRRRIFKRDGRVLEPEPTPHASQAHADLSQLEQGDIVEAIYEGFAIPGETGDIGIDTPDLLPERTAVHEATVELSFPAGLRESLWSHLDLGAASDRTEGGTRTLTWHMTDHAPRRVEDGVPKMDRSVAVSFSTARWDGVARALREQLATLDEHDPETAAWVRDALGEVGGKPSRAAVDALVVAAGKALHEPDASTLSDFAGGVTAVQAQTARTALTSHSGSRSWLILRGLREIGVAADLVVAENDPYSADSAFPPHFGRFLHPLVVAHVDGKDVWIDADVSGPPLPAGRVSPELRGRLALHTNGAVEPIPSFEGDDERDEVDVRLALDGQGGARGTFAVLLRGHDAQELAEALLRLVGAERQRALRSVVLAWLPWADVDDVVLASSEGSWQVSLRAQVSVSGYAEVEGAKTWLLPGIDPLHWAWPRPRVSSLGASFATRAGRESALALSHAVQYHVHRRIELPKGAVPARMPGPLDVKTKLVEASRKIAVMGDAIEDDFVLGVTTGTVGPKDYDAFVSVAHATDDAFLASTRVTAP